MVDFAKRLQVSRASVYRYMCKSKTNKKHVLKRRIRNALHSLTQLSGRRKVSAREVMVELGRKGKGTAVSFSTIQRALREEKVGCRRRIRSFLPNKELTPFQFRRLRAFQVHQGFA